MAAAAGPRGSAEVESAAGGDGAAMARAAPPARGCEERRGPVVSWPAVFVWTAAAASFVDVVDDAVVGIRRKEQQGGGCEGVSVRLCAADRQKERGREVWREIVGLQRDWKGDVRRKIANAVTDK
nr:unnamed protein product [Digitaria exilis]